MSYHPETSGERRHNPRKRTVGRVYLSWAGSPGHRCRVMDLSTAGALVDMGPLRVPMGAIVELAFARPSGPVIRMVRRSAVVVRRSKVGLALMFVWRRRQRSD